jgi:hypothetical protein
MEPLAEIKTIEVDQQMLKQLNTTRRWTMFLAIVGFILLGILIVMGILTGTFLSFFSPGDKAMITKELLAAIGFIVVTILYFFPVLYLLRFSNHMARAVHHMDSMEFAKAIKNLKSFFVFFGILTILALTAYISALIISGISLPSI